MKFEDIPLEVPSVDEAKRKIKPIIERLKGATSVLEAYECMKDFNAVMAKIETQMTVIEIRYSLDTNNKEYEKAQDAANDISPLLESVSNEYYKAICSSAFRKDLEQKVGKHYFDLAEINCKQFDDKIIDECVEENKLCTAYEKIVAGAQIEFRGQIYNLPQLGKFLSDKERATRDEAAHKYWGFYKEHNEEIGKIYDNLVHVRTRMAQKMGYKNYVDFGYLRLSRTDYNSKMVDAYREQIRQYVVPVSQKLRARQAKRLGIKNPMFYDYNLDFLSGNAKPVGNRDVLVGVAQNMYNEMSKETGEFFKMMQDNNLLDLEAKKGKQGGGYMTYLPVYKEPFIFSNFNGTSADVDVLTHEVGHAFQGYTSRNIELIDLHMPTMEACEIHSMSMEFFAEPWMENFFKNDKDKYLFSHLSDAINFLPYGASVDEFQHFAYENPEATHAERCAKWREIEKKYNPHLNYEGFDNLEAGCFWMKQSHIFENAFYYIDYTLAQVVAFQFYILLNKDFKNAWEKYYHLCTLGGQYSFLELLKLCDLKNPFEDGFLKSIMPPLEKALDKFDDQKM